MVRARRGWHGRRVGELGRRRSGRGRHGRGAHGVVGWRGRVLVVGAGSGACWSGRGVRGMVCTQGARCSVGRQCSGECGQHRGAKIVRSGWVSLRALGEGRGHACSLVGWLAKLNGDGVDMVMPWLFLG